MTAGITIRFWGTRGSVPVSSPEMAKAGGNTSCVEITCGTNVILFDAGSGLKRVAEEFEPAGIKDFDLFLSHCHYDHIIGLPFFKPLYCADMKGKIWSGHLGGAKTTREIVDELMRWPYLPMGIETLSSLLTYGDFRAGDVLTPREGIELHTATLKHPGGAMGYRLAYDGRAIAYITDTNHEPGVLDQGILGLIDAADLVIYDCALTEAEFPRYKAYGHSTWQHGVALCRAAGAKRFAIYHHSPLRTDAELAVIEAEAKASFPGAFVARDGLAVTI
ncbi:MBL fold metallo-hydrolase [soil metagenome]